ncbi:MAG: redoxin domain-containing protein [Proteobacteria bacterium]|nr:redoxin domain-containing protein [Pseudomonadota bacterium]
MKMRRLGPIFGAICSLFLLFAPCSLNGATVCNFQSGDHFPDIAFRTDISKEDASYLGLEQSFKSLFGLEKEGAFTLRDIGAELVIVEFINTYCTSCQAQAPVMNQVFELIEKDSHLRSHVKMLGVCAGNNPKEVDRFRREKKIRFPLISDLKFDAYEALGEPCGTPLVLLVKKSEKAAIIASSHIGLISTPLYFVQEVWDGLQTNTLTLEAKAREKRSQHISGAKSRPFISDEELQKKISSSLEARGKRVEALKKIELDPEQTLFSCAALDNGTQEMFFARLVSRNPVCDVCHAVHFVVLFDESGVVVDFIALHITKYGNRDWTAEEIKKTRDRLIGKSVLHPLSFDPHADAVSGATMSSALVFNAVERTEKEYRILQEKGYIKK